MYAQKANRFSIYFLLSLLYGWKIFQEGSKKGPRNNPRSVSMQARLKTEDKQEGTPERDVPPCRYKANSA